MKQGVVGEPVSLGFRFGASVGRADMGTVSCWGLVVSQQSILGQRIIIASVSSPQGGMLKFGGVYRREWKKLHHLREAMFYSFWMSGSKRWFRILQP